MPLSSEQSRELNRRRWANKTPEQRAAQGLCFTRHLTHEQLSKRWTEINKKRWKKYHKEKQEQARLAREQASAERNKGADL